MIFKLGFAKKALHSVISAFFWDSEWVYWFNDLGFFSDKNLARSCGKACNEACSTAQSSEYEDKEGQTMNSDKANDGNQNSNSWTATALMQNNWWRVDFGITRNIAGGTIWVRSDCCTDRLDGFGLWIGNSLTYNGQDNVNCYHATTTQHHSSPFTHLFKCIGSGRYFFVHLPSNNLLSLAEVEVLESGRYALH